MVPQLRTSHYTFLLSGAFPALRDSSPGNIQEPALPELRNVIVVNNTPDSTKFRHDLHGMKSAIDWRELMVWREDAKEKRSHQQISASLRKDDVINLQFTRLASLFINSGVLSCNYTNKVVPLGHRKQYLYDLSWLQEMQAFRLFSAHTFEPPQ
jgi:hypothetical protein